MTAHHVAVRGTRLYVDDRGPADRHAILLVHGGPGMGCGELMWAVGDRFADRFRVVGVDQRGCARSDPVPAEAITVPEIVADLEDLREHLGIDRWSLLAHSAGAPIAIEYAMANPGRVAALILDCPAIDAGLTDRARLPVVAERLRGRGEPGDLEVAERCLELAARSEPITAADRPWELVRGLGDDYSSLLLANPGPRNVLETACAAVALTEEEARRGESHRGLMTTIYRPRFSAAAALEVPQLLVRGKRDIVTAPAVVAAYRAAVPSAEVEEIADAAHFPALEQPDAYVRLIGDFVEKGAWG